MTKICTNCKYGKGSVSFCTNPERHKPTYKGDCWTHPNDTNSPEPQLTIDYNDQPSSIYITWGKNVWEDDQGGNNNEICSVRNK